MKTHYYDIVKRILIENPATRDDDMLLWGSFLAKFMIVLPHEEFYDVIQNARARKIPSYESITRARRKVQEREPNLRGKRYSGRKKEEREYREYYSQLMGHFQEV